LWLENDAIDNKALLATIPQSRKDWQKFVFSQFTRGRADFNPWDLFELEWQALADHFDSLWFHARMSDDALDHIRRESKRSERLQALENYSIKHTNTTKMV
jgi:hypothetical protein